MQAGKLRHRVTIQAATEARDSYGESIKTWSDVVTVWASVEDLGGRELLQAQQLEAEVTTRVTLRYRSGVTPEHRITWGSHTYDIKAISLDPTRARTLELLCSEVVT